jgi:hypothetical protein
MSRKEDIAHEIDAARFKLTSICMSCADKRRENQTTSMGTLASVKVSCNYGFLEYLDSQYASSKGNSHGGDSCPKLKSLFEKIERLEKEKNTVSVPSTPKPKPPENKPPPQPSTPQNPTISIPPGATAESLTKRGYICLEDSEWEKAPLYFDSALSIDPEYARAYVGLLCAKLEIPCEEDLPSIIREGSFEYGGNITLSFSLLDYIEYKRAVRYADSDYRIKIEGYEQAVQERKKEESQAMKDRREERIRINAENERQAKIDRDEKAYVRICKEKEAADTKGYDADMYYHIANRFRDIGGYKDAAKLAEECDNIGLSKAKERTYKEFIGEMQSAVIERHFNQLADNFRKLGNYKDADMLAKECDKKAKEAREKAEELERDAERRRIRQEKEERLEEELQQKRKEEQRRIAQSKRWEQQGLCPVDGGEFKGIFSKKCEICGKPK